MSHIKKISKLSVLFLILFLGMIYVMQYFLGTQFEQMNHLYLLTGGFSFWLAANIFAFVQFVERYDQKTNWYKGIISFVGYLACFVSFLTAIILILPQEGLPPESIAMVSLWFKIDIILLVYIIICIIFIWTKYIVRDETMVILDGKILYPGQEYEISPFLNCEASVMEKNFQLSLDAMELVCKNDRLRVTVSSSMEFDIEEAKRQEIIIYDFSTFYIEAEECLGSLVQKRAELMNVSEVIEGSMESEKLNIAGFPVIWNGDVQIST